MFHENRFSSFREIAQNNFVTNTQTGQRNVYGGGDLIYNNKKERIDIRVNDTRAGQNMKNTYQLSNSLSLPVSSHRRFPPSLRPSLHNVSENNPDD